MARWGVGPIWGLATLVYASVAVLAGRLRPDVVCLPPDLHGLWLAAGGILLLLGLGVYAVSLHALNEGFRKGVLVTKGPFAAVRHPIYAAWILLVIPAAGLLLESWLLLTTPVIAYLAFKTVIGKEDRALGSQFGDVYRQYRSKTPELFPRFARRGPQRAGTDPKAREALAERTEPFEP